jgi:hypothetical protein
MDAAVNIGIRIEQMRSRLKFRLEITRFICLSDPKSFQLKYATRTWFSHPKVPATQTDFESVLQATGKWTMGEIPSICAPSPSPGVSGTHPTPPISDYTQLFGMAVEKMLERRLVYFQYAMRCSRTATN